MPTYPNSALVQTLAPFYGSCKLEVSLDSGSTWTNIGLARGVNFNENISQSDIQADNGPDLKRWISDHTVEITFNALEFYLPTFNKIRGGIDLLTASSAVATTKTDSYTTGAKSYAVPIYFSDQGSSSTLPAVVKVASVDTAGASDTLDSTRDFSTFTDANNRSGVIMLSTASGGQFNDSEALKITYSFGDVQTQKLTSGGLSTIDSRWFRLTNKQIVSSTAKYRYLVVYSGTLQQGLQLAFKSANEDDPVLETAISIIAELDTTRTEGDQLFFIEDEVAV